MKIFRLPVMAALAATTMAALTPAMAETLSPASALERALRNENAGRMAPASARNMHLVHTETTSSSLPAVYVFSTSDNGYLLVSADDCVDTGLLGYADSGSFTPGEIPPAMSWWLGEYAREIEYAATNPRPATISPAKAVEPREPIGPLVTTRWNQSAPYNDLCPMVNGKRAVTGCVATALAQVMKYHNWPPEGMGSNAYVNPADNQTISMDFSKVKFDWDNMLDSYGGTATDAQKEAVATLMKACGVGVDMTYTANESGAPDVKAAYAMVNYFNYDSSVRIYIRDYYGIREWEQLVYDQLHDFGPVQYSGTTNLGGGHSFVCDGYSSDGYFHINWGWNGMSDGYFKLTALNPDTQGIGGSTAGYNSQQSIIGDVRKPVPGSRIADNLVMPDGFGISNTSSSPGSSIKVLGLIANYTVSPISMTLTVKITSDETGEEQYCTGQWFEKMPFSSGLNGWTVRLPNKIADGNYTLTPAFINSLSQYKDVPVNIATPQYAKMTVSKGICQFSEPELPKLSAGDINVLTPVYAAQLFKLTAKITNPGDREFYGNIVPVLAKNNRTYALAQSQTLDILPAESIDFDYTGAFLNFASAVEAGTYTLYLVQESSNLIIGEGIEIDFLGDAGTPKLSMQSFSFDGDKKNADRNHLVFKGIVKCSQGYFASNLQVVIFPMAEPGATVQALGSIQSKPVFVEENGTATFSAEGAFASGEPGKEYFAVVFNGQNQVSSTNQHIIFTIGETSGVDNVTAQETYNVFPNPTEGIVNINGTATIARVYNAAGAEVMRAEETSQLDLSTLSKGIYMVEILPADGSERVVRRVIRK